MNENSTNVLTDDTLKLVHKRLTSMSLCTQKTKIDYLCERDNIYSHEDLVQETMCNLIGAIKDRHLAFNSKYQVIKYAVNMFVNRIKYHTRAKTYIKKSNAITISMDQTFNENDKSSNVTTIGDILSDELHQCIDATFYDMVEALRKNLYIVVDGLHVSIVSLDELVEKHHSGIILSLNKYVYDVYSLNAREFSKKYRNSKIYLSTKCTSIINKYISTYMDDKFSYV